MLTLCNVLFEEHDQQQTSLIPFMLHFYRATSMQGSLNHERNVLSVKRVNCEKRQETFLYGMKERLS